MVIVGNDDEFVFTASSMGFGKKTKAGLYPRHRRGGKGVVNLKFNKKIGNAIGMISISDQEILLITQVGKIIRIKTEKVRPLGRATQGVKIINLEKGDRVVSLAMVKLS